MKIFTAGVATETNTFSPMPTGLDDYTQIRGASEENPGPYEVPLKVFRTRARERGWEVVESLMAFAQPAGLTPRTVYEGFREEILADLKAALPVDIVLLNLHGAMVAEGYDDCEGDLIGACRGVAGEKAIIGVELDPHCHLTQAMLDQATAIVIYKEYPHTDFAERAEELFAIVADAALGRCNPVMSTFDCRLVNMYYTTLEPMKGYVGRLKSLEGSEGVLSLSVAHGFPWADVEDLGTKLLAITDNRPEQGASLAKELGLELIGLREHTRVAPLSFEQALDKAAAATGGPLVMADGSDNAGGGAPSDSTYFLRAFLERGINNAAIANLWDPVAVELAAAAGEGARLTLRLGGKMGPTSGDPVDLDCTVTCVRDNVIQRYSGTQGSLGAAVALQANGIDVVVNTQRNQVWSPDCFSELGIDPLRRNILVVKSFNHFRVEFEKIAKEIWYVAAPGALEQDFRKIPYTKLKRPLWPLNANALTDLTG